MTLPSVAESKLRLLLIANMYPAADDPQFGVFIAGIEDGLTRCGVSVDRLVTAGRGRTLPDKMRRYLSLYSRMLTVPLAEYDVVQLSYPSHTWLPFSFRAWPKNTRLVVRLHGLDLVAEQESGFHQCLTDLFTRPALARADLVVVPSTYFRDLLWELHGPMPTFVYPSGGVDRERFHPGRPQLVDGTVGYVGRLDRFKGVEVLLSALVRSKRWKQALIVGDGECREELERMASRLGLDGRVTFTGMIPHHRLPEYYRRMAVMVFPTLRKGESFGNVTIEAMACGVPVIGSDMAGLRDTIVDGENGFRFPPGDATALAACLDQFLATPESGRDHLRQGALRTAARYDRLTVSRAYVEKLVEICRNTSA